MPFLSLTHHSYTLKELRLLVQTIRFFVKTKNHLPLAKGRSPKLQHLAKL